MPHHPFSPYEMRPLLADGQARDQTRLPGGRFAKRHSLDFKKGKDATSKEAEDIEPVVVPPKPALLGDWTHIFPLQARLVLANFFL